MRGGGGVDGKLDEPSEAPVNRVTGEEVPSEEGLGPIQPGEKTRDTSVECLTGPATTSTECRHGRRHTSFDPTRRQTRTELPSLLLNLVPTKMKTSSMRCRVSHIHSTPTLSRTKIVEGTVSVYVRTSGPTNHRTRSTLLVSRPPRGLEPERQDIAVVTVGGLW